MTPLTPQRRKSLQTSIARLKREIARLQAKPESTVSDPRRRKMAKTRRENAIKQRISQIARYTELLNN